MVIIFCHGLDIRVPKLVEATNGYSLVEAENDIWYDIVRGCDVVAFSVERGIFMARKSRKHQRTEMIMFSIANAVGYVRLSVANREESNSIQNQKFIIECWGDRQQIPISQYYIEVIFSANGVRFVSINEQFDIIDGITNQERPYSSRIRVPITNAFNEQVSIEIKMKVEAASDMKAQHDTFIVPRAPFGYQKSFRC